MKKLIVFCLFLAVSGPTFSQLKIASNDSTVILSNIYVGLLNSVAVNSDFKAQPSSSLRVGSDMFWHLSPVATVKGRIIYCRIDGSDLLISFFSLKLHSKSGKVSLEAGHMPTLSTEMMPHPLTQAGQFMSWTEWQMTGPGVGAKANFKTAAGSFGLGLAQRGDKPEYHFKWEKGTFAVSACSGLSGKYFQSAASFKPDYLYQVTLFRHDFRGNLLANYTSVPIGHDLALCLDAGYYFGQNSPEKLEIGMTKSFKAQWLKGIFYFFYTQENHSLNASLLLDI